MNKNIKLEDLAELMGFAVNLARKNNQTIGDKNDLYITLQQLDTLLCMYKPPDNDILVKVPIIGEIKDKKLTYFK